MPTYLVIKDIRVSDKVLGGRVNRISLTLCFEGDPPESEKYLVKTSGKLQFCKDWVELVHAAFAAGLISFETYTKLLDEIEPLKATEVTREYDLFVKDGDKVVPWKDYPTCILSKNEKCKEITLDIYVPNVPPPEPTESARIVIDAIATPIDNS